MNPELRAAIDRLNAALDELEKRQAARALGVAIGNVLGTTSTNYRTPSQIDAMSLSEIDAWGLEVESNPEIPPQ
jgi:hypothetical protein